MNTNIRRQFELPDGIYLANHGVGCLPIHARQPIDDFFSRWAQRGVAAWHDWLEGIEQFQHALAKLLGGNSLEYCPQGNISGALTKIISSLPVRSKRSKILTSKYAFPTIGFVLQQSGQNHYQIEFAHQDKLDDGLEYWDNLLKTDIQAVVLMHGYSNLGTLCPIADIAKLARERGIFTIVDVAQTAGIIPIAVHEWNVDFVIGSCIKWLCGGPGAGFLWCNQNDLHQFEPTQVGWFSHANPFEMDIQNFRYHDSAHRFWGGTPSITPYMIATVGLDIIHTMGIHTIYQHNQRLIDILLQALQEHQAMICSPHAQEHRSGTIVVDFQDKTTIDQLFQEHKIIVDYRHGYRISPHIYNTEQEILQVVTALTKLGKHQTTCQIEPY